MATKKPKVQAVRKPATTTPSVHPAVVISLMLVVFAITRWWAAAAGLQWISYPSGKSLFSDVTLYDFWGFNISHGVFPDSSTLSQDQLWTKDAWQYPALAALIFILGNKIHGALIGFIQLAILADLALLSILLWHGRERKDANGRVLAKTDYVPALIWLAAPIFIGPLLVGRFDVFPTLAIVAALTATASSRRYGIWTSIGFLLKVWPVFGLLGLAKSKFKDGFIWFAAVGVTVTAALYLWWPGSLSFISGQGKRGLQIESVGALPYMMFGTKDDRNAIAFRYGSWEVNGAGTELVSLVMTLALVALIGLLAYWRWQGRLENIPAADIVLLAVLISMCTSRVLSPQYSIWIVGLLAAAAFARQEKFWLIATLLLTSVAFGQYLFPVKYSDFQLLHPSGILIQTVRIVCLLAATVLCWRGVVKRLESVERSA